MTDENTQLTPASGYNAKERMIFSDPISGEIPDSKPKIEFKRINISTLNEDGSVGELIIPTGRLYSFGVSENTSMETGKVTGHTFPLCLWSRDGATDEEKQILVFSKDVKGNEAPEVTDSDGNELEFDGFKEKYFQFLQNF